MSSINICIYDRVTLANGKQGEVQFMGPIEGKGDSIFYGIKLDDQQGKNNGTVNNIRYFECTNKHGIFVKAQKIKKSEVTQLNEVLPRVSIGDRVKVKDKRQHGILRFVGITQFDKGSFYGVELEEPLGENDGSVNDRQYFECSDYYGIFCKVNNIEQATFGKIGGNKLKPKKQTYKSNSDIASIKNNYVSKQKTAIVAPPPPMPEPQSPSSSNQQNLLDQDIETMGFIQLKARCGMEGLSTFGTKKQLLGRLRQHIQKNGTNNKPKKINTQNNNNNNNNKMKYPPPKQSNSDFDPELHDIPPEKDDFFKPIVNHDVDDDDASRQGSVIYNRNVNQFDNMKAKGMSALADGDEDAPDDNNNNNNLQNSKPNFGKARSHVPNGNMNSKLMNKPPLKQSNSALEVDGTNPNNSMKNKSDNKNNNNEEKTNVQDWIMLPDPNTGKMYYANLKTKETRWQAPPGFGVTDANLNPGYNPQLTFANNGANNMANQWQNRPSPAVWQSFSTQNLAQYANQQNNAPNPQGQYSQQQQNPGYLGRQVSPFVSATNMNQQYNPAQAYQQNPQWTQSANNMGYMAGQNNLNTFNNAMPKTKSAINMSSNNNQPNKSNQPKKNTLKNKNVQKRKESRKPTDNNLSVKNKSNVDPLAALEAAKWKKTVDASTGREYWYHKETKATTWEPPPAVLKVSAESAVGGISGMQEIAKADWEQNSDSEYSSGSGSYYSDGDTESESEDDKKTSKYNQQQQQYTGQYPQGQPNYGNQWGQPQTGYQPQGQNQWAQPQNQNQWNNQHQQQGGYNAYNRPQPAQQNARQMYLKPLPGNPSDHTEEKTAEDNPWISAEEAKSRVIVRDTLKRYWQIGAEQSFKLDGWAKQHYFMSGHKKGLFGKKQQTVSDILSYSDHSKMKQPLNKESLEEEKLREQCMQTWKNINSYMGIRKSGKSSEGHVEKLVRYALKGDSRLRNEVYCQLAKQTTKNPKLQSLLKGWKLLLICCSFFPPSDEFVDYLACFIWNNTQQPNEIGQYAIKALHALDATMLSGGRKFPPLPLEIVKLENLQPIPLNIYFINGMKCKQVLVTSQTRAKQVIETLAQTFNFKHPEAFGLYEMEPNIPPLDKMKKHYIKRELMSQQEKINDLIRMPFERELEEDDRMLDVIASWLKRDARKKNKNSEKNSSSKKKKNHRSSKNVRFVLKVKTFRKPMEKNFSHMGAKANFLTHVWHVVNDFYPIGIEDEEFAFDLAALQLQGTYGPKPKLPATSQSKFDQNINNNQHNIQKAFYKQGIIAYDLHKYLGQTILKKYLPGDRNQCENKILQFRLNKYSNMSRSDCWLRYAKMLRSNKKLYNYFGCSWYRGVRIQGDNDMMNGNNNNNDKGMHSKYGHHKKGTKGTSIIHKADRNTNDLLVGINEHAISFVNPITQNIVERYEMEEILTFGYRSNAFLFVAGTLMTQSKMQIATMHGKAMNRLVRTHIDLRVRDAEKKGQKIKNVPKTNVI